MGAPTHLHVYRCSLDQTIATSTVRDTRTPIKCIRCLRIMAFKWSQPITTQEERDIAARGVVFNPFIPRTSTKRQCDTCHDWIEKDLMIRLGAGGKYCGQDCADIGTEKHRAVMARIEELYQERPWMRPAAKESA